MKTKTKNRRWLRMGSHRLFGVANKIDDRPTPDEVFGPLNQEFGFTIDAAASPENAKCEKFFTADEDGVSQIWEGVVWCNPPYSEIGLWVRKAQESRDTATSVLLLPASTDVAWFHEWVLPFAEIRFLRGRITFVGQKAPAPFGSMVAIYRKVA